MVIVIWLIFYGFIHNNNITCLDMKATKTSASFTPIQMSSYSPCFIQREMSTSNIELNQNIFCFKFSLMIYMSIIIHQHFPTNPHLSSLFYVQPTCDSFFLFQEGLYLPGVAFLPAQRLPFGSLQHGIMGVAPCVTYKAAWCGILKACNIKVIHRHSAFNIMTSFYFLLFLDLLVIVCHHFTA